MLTGVIDVFCWPLLFPVFLVRLWRGWWGEGATGLLVKLGTLSPPGAARLRGVSSLWV